MPLTNVFIGIPKKELKRALDVIDKLPRTQEILAVIKQLRLALLAVILFSLVCFGQTPSGPAHTANLTWTNSPDTANTNVFRQSGQCPSIIPSAVPSGAAELNITPITTGNYSDTGVIPGQYCYFVASVLNGVQSNPIQVQANIPLAPPSGLTASVK